jgi:hypothetical protein
MKVQKPWQGWLAAIAATLVTTGLVIAEIDDTGLRHWWSGHALTTDTVSGLLVLLITLLVVNQVVHRRQVRSRARAVAAQAAILVGQAIRADRAVSAARDGSGDPDSAAAEVRTYMMMLLVGAPLLIEDRTARAFLEQAQYLAGEMTRVLLVLAKAPATPATPATPGAPAKPAKRPAPDARLKDAVARVRKTAAPLLQQLNLDELIAAGADGNSDGNSDAKTDSNSDGST